MRLGQTMAGGLMAAALLTWAGPAFAHGKAGATMMAHQKASVTILSPRAGDTIGGPGWDVQLHVVIPAKYMIAVKPGLMTSMAMVTGASKAFPGLVVTDSANAKKMGGPTANLAALFQIVGERHDAHGNAVIDADWFISDPMYAMAAMSTIRAFVVSGVAPATEAMMPTDKAIGTMVGTNTLVSNVAFVGVSARTSKRMRIHA